MIRMSSEQTSPPPGPTPPMTSLTGHTCGSATSDSQIALNNFKRGSKMDASAFPIFKNDLYYDSFQKSFMAKSRHKDSMFLQIQILTLMMVINMTSNFSMRNNLFSSVLVTSLQTDKGRELVKEVE